MIALVGFLLGQVPVMYLYWSPQLTQHELRFCFPDQAGLCVVGEPLRMSDMAL